MAKPKKPKAIKLALNSKQEWRNILKDVSKEEVPIHVLEKLAVQLKDGTQVIVDIKNLLSMGADPEDVEDHVNTRLEELDDYIDNVDFYVDLDKVENTVQPITAQLLSKL